VRAKVPLDVDLEDRLVYGLTPIRLAYVVLAGLGGLAIWSAHRVPSAARGAMAVLVISAGAVLAWGRWRGRAADEWLMDAARYAAGSVRISR